MIADASVASPLAFGPFRLFPARRLLLEGETPVRLGSRAWDLLMALLEQAGQEVTKEALGARIWPNIVVEDATLRAQVAALRKALRDGQNGRRYIASIAGRGYAFVGELAAIDVPSSSAAPELPESALPDSTLPDSALPDSALPDSALPDSALLDSGVALSTTRLFGRADIIETLAQMLAEQRLVTIVGPGGMGKTSVALAVADRLRRGLKDGVCLVDLAPLADARLVPTAVASALGMRVASDDPLPSLIALLRNRAMLIVLDNCEHVIDSAALLAEAVAQSGGRARILATSREAMGVPGERVLRLAPLALPESSERLTAADAMTYPAVQLFVERAAMSLGEFSLTDAQAPAIAAICRHLDGIALAIEIAAGQVGAFGIAGLARVLDDRFRLAMQGRRTALPRHRTMSTTLDWSYQLLPESERAVLRRLAVFTGFFTIPEAIGVLAADGAGALEATEGIANLVTKSLLVPNFETPVATYRLLETTRAYALQKLEESGEREACARRHARQCLAAMEAANLAWDASPPDAWLARHRHLVDDVRAALDFSLRTADQAGIAVALTVASVPLWYQLSLLNECYVHAGRALALPQAARSTAQALRLTAATAWSLMQIKGFVRETEEAWTRVLGLSREGADAEYQLRALWGLWATRINAGSLSGSLALAQEFSLLARGTSEIDRCVGDRMVGHSLHLLGDQAGARFHLERMLANYVSPATGAQVMRYVFDQRALSCCFLARIRWLQGFPDEARRIAWEAIAEERSRGDALSLCQVLVQAACPIGLLVGDLEAVEGFVAELGDIAERHQWRFWQAFAACFRGVLIVQRGDIAAGLPVLEAALTGLRGIDFGVHYLFFLCHHAAALGQAGRGDLALETIEQAIERSDRNEERWCVAEVLRVKGELLHRRGNRDEAAAVFSAARDWAERQGALSWSLRIAASAARLAQDTGRAAEARADLARVLDRFTEGHGTTDHAAARALLVGAHDSWDRGRPARS
jgi:predicted ATPase/DNA-binding winged helix-turn-helix (wHTH) protein